MVLPDRLGWHALQHSQASLLIAAGLSPRAVADRLGHADPKETLSTYAHLWLSDEARILAAIKDAYGDGIEGSRRGFRRGFGRWFGRWFGSLGRTRDVPSLEFAQVIPVGAGPVKSVRRNVRGRPCPLLA